MIEKIVLEKMSGLMQTGVIEKIYVKDNEQVNKGENIMSISAEKANFEVAAEKSGYIKLMCKEGDELPVGAVLAIIADSVEELTKIEESLKPPSLAEKAEKDVIVSAEKKIRVQPIAKRLAQEYNLDLANVQGTGPNGIITKKDVENAAKKREETGAEEISLTGVKKSMFEHIEKAKEYVQATTFMEIDMSKVKEMRLKKNFSYTTYIIKAVSQSLKKFPIINSILEDKKITIKKQINIGVALDYEGQLYVPVIKNAADRPLEDISNCINEFKEKVAKKTLTIKDMSEGTFTITNSGIFGSSFFVPVINYPQSAILGIGKITERPIIIENSIVIRPILIASLGYDHRIIEGSNAVKFLGEIKNNLENIDKLI
ncbi:MAG TPA: 2-oxo acid dehydrogenase subunit E2 [Tepidanaerobacter syntrophicus]|uniref:dihydrolipoamide acetyltransferase family protein n=1 Tax=Tepidanaerobacter syntrophicus TaxID=224999 RepID=UPI0017765CAE|nr:dihydrolipoamide acetyltransferase family protein [Tepidanaerobacter syntrophicus]HHV83055.1 2-oxo acid dehydrogenase subunit E2 [Tepidanaerobacter syntrophicus]